MPLFCQAKESKATQSAKPFRQGTDPYPSPAWLSRRVAALKSFGCRALCEHTKHHADTNRLASAWGILYEYSGQTPTPVKRTRAITLLITGTVFFTGCSKQQPLSDDWGGEEKPSPTPSETNSCTSGHSTSWFFWGRPFWGGGSSLGYGGGTSSGVSSQASSGSVSRGGFGSTAGHSSASS